MLQKQPHAASTTSTNVVFLIKEDTAKQLLRVVLFDLSAAAIGAVVLSVGCLDLSPHGIKPKG